jgi:hypothetical protein
MEKDVQQPASDQDEPKQTTGRGYEIPVPTKGQVMTFFKKVTRATKKD